MTRKWNVVATLAVILVLAYAIGVTFAFVSGKTEFAGYQEAMLAVLLPVLGYLARMLGEPEEP